MKRLVLLVSASLACSSADTTKPTPPPIPTPATLVVVSGDSQTTAVTTAFPAPLVVRLTDEQDHPLAGYPVIAEAQDLGRFQAVTNQDGVADIGLQASTLATTFVVHIHVDLAAYYNSVTTQATAIVAAGPPTIVTFRDFPQKALLAESLSVTNLVAGAGDHYGNVVTITSQELAPVLAPYSLNAGHLTSAEEVSQPLDYLVNGVPFPVYFSFYQDLRALSGGTGSWKCASSAGAPVPGGVSLVRDGAIQIDSVRQGGAPGDEWTLYTRIALRDSLTTGSIQMSTASDVWEISQQRPGTWQRVYSDFFHKTSATPLTYAEASPGATYCQDWGGTTAHTLLTLTH